MITTRVRPRDGSLLTATKREQLHAVAKGWSIPLPGLLRLHRRRCEDVGVSHEMIETHVRHLRAWYLARQPW